MLADLNVSPLAAAVAVGLLLVALFVWVRSRGSDGQAVLVNGVTQRVSLYKTGQFVALVTTSWALVHQTLNGTLTEWLFTVYLVTWSGANLASKWVDLKAG